MSKFKVGDRVKSRFNKRLVGMVQDDPERCYGESTVRFRLDYPTQKNSVREFVVMSEDDIELTSESAVKVGQRVLIVKTPRPETKFAVGRCGTVIGPADTGGVFHVELDDSYKPTILHGVVLGGKQRIYCDLSMVHFFPTSSEEALHDWNVQAEAAAMMDPARKAPVKPLVDETFLLTESGYKGAEHAYITYDLKFEGLVSVSGGSAFRGGQLKLHMSDASAILKTTPKQKYRLTLTPIEEAKFKVGDRVVLKYRPQLSSGSYYCYVQGFGEIIAGMGSGFYRIQLDTESSSVAAHEDALELAPKTEKPLPCPFCGFAPVDDGTSLACTKCRRTMTCESTKEARVTAWNWRAR